MPRYRYYYRLVEQVLKFLIPRNKSVLYYGAHNIGILRSLCPSYAVCVDRAGLPLQAEPGSIIMAVSPYEDYNPGRQFDYIVLDVAVGQTKDINHLLKKLHSACSRHTRIIIHQENYLWQWIFRLATTLNLKNKEGTQNWLSVTDIKTYLQASGFETTRVFKKTFFPLRWIFIGPVLNYLFSILPFFDFIQLDQYIVARKMKGTGGDEPGPQSLTICLTVRDEEKNIEAIVKSLPVLAAEQEILFVEGHSRDKTVSEIQRMQAEHPSKNIRLIQQDKDKKGQADAIKIGFKAAKGDIIILYEGDGTSEPRDLEYVYDAMCSQRFEFIEGSRFVYPLTTETMPFINKAGNIFFAKWFTMFLNQRITDTLSGIKAVFKKDYENIYNTWGFLGIDDPFGDFELLFGAAKYGLKIGEVPIHYKPRTYGVSKTNVWLHGTYLFRMAINGYFIFRNSKVR